MPLKKLTVWIAFVEVEALTSEHGFRPGEQAFVNVLVAAASEKMAAQEIRDALNEHGFHIISLERPEPWENRLPRAAKNEVAPLAKLVQKNGGVQFGPFHMWENQG